MCIEGLQSESISSLMMDVSPIPEGGNQCVWKFTVYIKSVFLKWRIELTKVLLCTEIFRITFTELLPIIYRYIFWWFWDYHHFAGIKILLFSLVSEMANHSIVMLTRLQASKAFVCVYKILCFCANPQKFQTLVPTKNGHLKVGQLCKTFLRA